jgi:energy-coupling factor transporter transmembrane protein EcfT
MRLDKKTKKTLLIVSLIALLAVSILIAVSYSARLPSLSVAFWQEGGWFIAPSGYVITNGGTQFCAEDAYNANDEVVGFRWKIQFVNEFGQFSYVYADGLPPQDGVVYSWSPYPYGWIEVGNKIGYPAEKYSGWGSSSVWVYAPLTRTAPTPTPVYPTPTPWNPTPTPSGTVGPSTTPTPTPTRDTTAELAVITGFVIAIVIALMLFARLKKK